MKIMISGCLLGENCKYNGTHGRRVRYTDKVAEHIKGHEVISVCPECLGGLPTPRIPAEIVDGVVTNKAGEIVDVQFRKGAEIALETAKRERIDLAILQSRSPSCGVKQVYDGTFSGKRIDGPGVFAKLLKENGFQVIDVEDL